MFVFVYGTLTDPGRVDAVVDDWSFEGAARLVGLRRAEGRYPTLVPPAASGGDASAGGVDGRLLRTPDVAALDAYEGVDRGLYARASVPVEDREAAAAVYVGDPARLGVDAAWPGDGRFEERVRRYIDERWVVVRPADE